MRRRSIIGLIRSLGRLTASQRRIVLWSRGNQSLDSGCSELHQRDRSCLVFGHIDAAVLLEQHMHNKTSDIDGFGVGFECALKSMKPVALPPWIVNFAKAFSEELILQHLTSGGSEQRLSIASAKYGLDRGNHGVEL